MSWKVYDHVQPSIIGLFGQSGPGGYAVNMRSDTLMSEGVNDNVALANARVKVHIRCRKCGETFILRGVRDTKGNIETGFKRCLCDNEEDFDIESLN